MGMDVYATVYWGICLERELCDPLLSDVKGDVVIAELADPSIRRLQFNPIGRKLLVEYVDGGWQLLENNDDCLYEEITDADILHDFYDDHALKYWSVESESADGPSPDITTVRVSQIAASKDIRVDGFNYSRRIFDTSCDGWIVGFEGPNLFGAGPYSLDLSQFTVQDNWLNELRTFCETYGVAWSEPQWWHYISGSI